MMEPEIVRFLVLPCTARGRECQSNQSDSNHITVSSVRVVHFGQPEYFSPNVDRNDLDTTKCHPNRPHHVSIPSSSSSYVDGRISSRSTFSRCHDDALVESHVGPTRRWLYKVAPSELHSPISNLSLLFPQGRLSRPVKLAGFACLWHCVLFFYSSCSRSKPAATHLFQVQIMKSSYLAITLATLVAAVSAVPVKRDVDPALVPEFGHQAGLNPTGKLQPQRIAQKSQSHLTGIGTGDCDGIPGPNGQPIKIPCICPPDRGAFIAVSNLRASHCW